MTRNVPCTTCKRPPGAPGTESLRVSMTRSVAPTTDKRGWRYDRLDTENFGLALLMTYFFDKAKGIVDTTIVFAADAPAATISDRIRRGELVRLATGVHTCDVTCAPAAVVAAREWHTIASMLPSRASAAPGLNQGPHGLHCAAR